MQLILRLSTFVLVSKFSRIDSNPAVECIKWHQTGNCSSNGIREPHEDKSCEATIDAESGYCKFSETKIAMPKGCYGPEHYNYSYNTCMEACEQEAFPQLYSSTTAQNNTPLESVIGISVGVCVILGIVAITAITISKKKRSEATVGESNLDQESRVNGLVRVSRQHIFNVRHDLIKASCAGSHEDPPAEAFGDVYGDLNDNVELQVAQNPYYEGEVETNHNSIRIPNINMNDMEVITSRENDYYEM